MKVKDSRPLFTISVAAELTNSHPRTLMLYEKKGLLTPFRTSTNRRLYSPKNIAETKFIQYLTQEKGINLAGAKLIIEAIISCKKRKFNLEKDLFTDYTEAFPF